MELLRQRHEGLIALSACLSGDVPKLLLQGRYDEARKSLALEFESIMGKGNYFLEMQDHGLREQKLVNQGLIRIWRQETGIPLVCHQRCALPPPRGRQGAGDSDVHPDRQKAQR